MIFRYLLTYFQNFLTLHCGGGGGGGENYENLERLYGIQADQAERLMGFSNQNVYPLLQRQLQAAENYGSIANQNTKIQQAAAQSEAAAGGQKQQLADQLQSLGINPADSRYARAFKEMGVQAGGQQAAAMSAAGDKVYDKGFAMTQDALGMAMGTPTQATAALNGATNAATQMYNGQLSQQAAQAQGMSNAVRAGIDLYGVYNRADGGQVRRYETGGYVQKLAGGGVVGFPAVPAPPPRAGVPQQPGAAAQVGNAAIMAAPAVGPIGKGVAMVGDAVGSSQMSAFGQGMSLGTKGAAPAVEAYKNAAAQAQVDAMMPSVVPEAASNIALESGAVGTGAESALALEAGTTAAAAGEGAATAGLGTAAALGETGAALGAGAALGTAVPVIGAGLLAAKAFGLFAAGGEVDGPGGPKDDLIPAMLSDGEFVMPVGTVKKYGIAKLEKMRQEGLQFEKELGIGRQRKAA